MDFLNSELERMEISMTGVQYEEFYGIIAELSNNTRISENRGFTPNEIYEMMKDSDKPKKIVLGQNLKSDFKNGSLNREEFVQGLISGIEEAKILEIKQTEAELDENRINSLIF